MLEINFHHLKVFHAVARRLSYSRAAEQLYISQPAVSRVVQDLEKAVGTPLFLRQGKRISLTEAGRRVYDYAQRVLDLTDELEQAIREMEDVTKGRLRLAACSTLGIYVLPAFLSLFRQRYPNIDISLHVANSQLAAEAVRQGDHHLGFVSMEIESPGIQWQTLARDELVVIVPAGHPFAGQTVTGAQLCQEPLLLRDPGSGTRRCVELELERLGQRPERVVEMGGTESIKRAVTAGLGVSAVSGRSLAGTEADGSLAIVTVEGMDLTRPLGLLTRKGTRVPPSALTFSAALRKSGV